MTEKDLTGQPMRCSNKKAIEHFNKGVVEYMLAREDCGQHFQKVLKMDDTMIIPRCLMVYCAAVSSVLSQLYMPCRSYSASQECRLQQIQEVFTLFGLMPASALKL